MPDAWFTPIAPGWTSIEKEEVLKNMLLQIIKGDSVEKAAKAAAGIAEEPYDAATLAEALDGVRGAHPGELVRVLQRCSFLVDGDPVGTRAHETVRLAEGGTVEVLPPFAGG